METKKVSYCPILYLKQSNNNDIRRLQGCEKCPGYRARWILWSMVFVRNHYAFLGHHINYVIIKGQSEILPTLYLETLSTSQVPTSR